MSEFFVRLVKEKPLSIVAGVVILLLILVAIFADVLAPYPHDEVNIVDRMQAPSDRYLLGTDHLGRDLLSRLVFGARISLTVGLAATTVNVVVAAPIGGISGFFGGRLDLAMQRFVDAWMAFPGLLLLLKSSPNRASGCGHRRTASQNTSSQPWNTTIRPMKRTPGNCRASRSSARYRRSCVCASSTTDVTAA